MSKKAVVLLLLTLVSACKGKAAPTTSIPADGSSAAGGEVFVSEAAAALILAQPGAQVVDVRAKAAYEVGHLPAALHLDASGLRATIDGVGGQVADQATAQERFVEAGLQNEAAIVVYGDATDTAVTRVYWTLKYYGHDSVSILDGGLAAWTGATESGASQASASDYQIAGAQTNLRVDAEWIAQRLDDDKVVLFDARSSSEYDNGHIPGAIHVNWTDNVGESSLLAVQEVRALYASAKAGDTLVSYCQSGSRAAVTFSVLKWLGFADVRLYDGSWAEWGSRQDLPKSP